MGINSSNLFTRKFTITIVDIGSQRIEKVNNIFFFAKNLMNSRHEVLFVCFSVYKGLKKESKLFYDSRPKRM